jgi:ParB family transcriptional regulator, chromosome partitioning protein
MTSSIAAEKPAEKKDEKRKALGRGLASLLPGPRVVRPVPPPAPPISNTPIHTASTDAPVAVATPSAPAPDQHEHTVAFLDIELIDKNPYQTRYTFDEEMLAELADSIRENGVVQPIVVRPADNSRYTLVLGERRLRASKLAGKSTIPALVRRLSPQQAAEMTVLENVQREDLNPLEQAEAFRVLSKEFQLTQAQIAERIGVSRETVANYMRLLRLPQQVMGYLVSGRLSFSDCRELLALQKEEHILQVAEEVVTKHLKWDEIEDRVARLNGFLPDQPGGAPAKQTRAARWMDPNVRAAQMEMERTLGMRVKIKDRNGKGKIVIEYATVDDYERVVEMLKGK